MRRGRGIGIFRHLLGYYSILKKNYNLLSKKKIIFIELELTSGIVHDIIGAMKEDIVENDVQLRHISCVSLCKEERAEGTGVWRSSTCNPGKQADLRERWFSTQQL